MKREEQIKSKIADVIDILTKFGMPPAQLNERTAYCILALTNITPEKDWENAENPLVGITPMMAFAKEYYNKTYAPNTRETFRRFSAHQLVQVYQSQKEKRAVRFWEKEGTCSHPPVPTCRFFGQARKIGCCTVEFASPIL